MKKAYLLAFFYLLFAFKIYSQGCPGSAAALAAGGTFDGTCAIDLGGSTTITGPVIWTAGTLTLNNGNLIIGTGGSIDIQGGTITMGNGIFTVNAGQNVTIGSGAQLNGSNANDIIISGTMDVYGTVQTYNANGGDVEVIGGYVTVYNMGHIECSDDFQVTSGGTLEVQTGGSVFFNDNMRNNQENGASSQATFIINGTVTGGDGNDDGSQIVVGDTTPDSSFSGSGSITIDNPIDDSEGGPYDGCAAGCIALPVELIYFKANPVSTNHVQLNWKTASELNNEGFSIEQSHDGLTYHEIGFVRGHGTVNEVQSYQFLDENFIVSSYYRLKQIDFDGQFEYLPTVFASSSENSELILYPNPTSDKIYLAFNSGESYDVNLINMAGIALINEANQSVANIESLLNQQITNLQNGIYLVRISNRAQRFEKRLHIVK